MDIVKVGKYQTKNKQPIKAITHQEIYLLKSELEKLASWAEPLTVMKHYFDESSDSLNKKKLSGEYHAQAQLFHAFYNDFLFTIHTLEKKIDKLRSAKKVRG